MAYPVGTIAVWEFENNKIDVVNGYTLTPLNGGGSFYTTNPTPAYGSYHYHATLTNKSDYIPQAALQAMKGVYKWTIEWYMWFPTKYTQTPGLNTGNIFSSSQGFNFFILTNDNWNPWGTNMNFTIKANSVFNGTYSTTAYTNGTANAWNRVTVTYNSTNNTDGVYKLYFNGILTWTSGGSQATIFSDADTTGWMTTGQYTDFNSYYCLGEDRLIFYGDDTGGVQILPLPDGKAGIKIGFNCGGNNRIKIGGLKI